MDHIAVIERSFILVYLYFLNLLLDDLLEKHSPVHPVVLEGGNLDVQSLKDQVRQNQKEDIGGIREKRVDDGQISVLI